MPNLDDTVEYKLFISSSFSSSTVRLSDMHGLSNELLANMYDEEISLILQCIHGWPRLADTGGPVTRSFVH